MMFHRLGGYALILAAVMSVSAGCIPKNDAGVDPDKRNMPGNSGTSIDPNKVDDTTKPTVD